MHLKYNFCIDIKKKHTLNEVNFHFLKKQEYKPNLTYESLAFNNIKSKLNSHYICRKHI